MTALISVIVTTYNWPQALSACLNSLLTQTDHNFEILIADDGSGPNTGQLIAEFIAASPIAIRHVFHEDQGFRAGAIRNKAAAASRGNYLLFVDGDCVLFPHFIARHRRLAENGYFVPGNRILLSKSFTTQVLQQQIPLQQASLAYFIGQRLLGNINRLLPLCHLPLDSLRHLQPLRWQKAMTCNMGVRKSDFLAINGFDEQFEGWGFEDSDLVIRLIHHGVRRKEGRFAVPVLHLWHPQNDRTRHDSNYQRLLERLADAKIIRSERGVEQYL